MKVILVHGILFAMRMHPTHYMRVPYLFDFRGWPKSLIGIRTIIVSPFTTDNSQVIYMGGCTGGPLIKLHNTAWIYSVNIDTALGH